MQAGGQAQAGGAMTLPGAAPAAAQAAPGDSDHDAVVGSLGFGYMGRRSMAVGCNGTAGNALCVAPGGVGAGAFNPGAQNVDAPIIGLRYWIDQTLGIDAGIGVAFASSSLNIPPGTDVPQPSYNAFLIHGGLPLALASSGHYSFQVIPEVNVGFSSWSQDGVAGGLGFSGSGFHFDVGARAGAEIHFGFIGLPKLALQGSIGLLFRTESQNAKDKTTGDQVKASSTAFSTTVQDNPWNIFTSNVAALYYF
jgi:hypothetical protein